MNNGEKALILVVDDDPVSLDFIRKVLTENKYDSVLVEDGAQAFKYLAKGTADLILLDIVMPKMDGLEVCKRLKKHNLAKKIPVIFLTGKTSMEDIIKGFQAGAVDYVKKPFNPAELLMRIKSHVELKRAREEIKTLRGMIPICANCKKIRNDDEGLWEQIEGYIEKHSEAFFSHGICPECSEQLYGDQEWFKKRHNKEEIDTPE
ncbi:MAG: response regulator [Candidatus Aminicenantes bacterium]|nr:response regulator [Candidatus Aminicenantes bacterium]